jgi:outer membrane protein assembly factor BamB
VKNRSQQALGVVVALLLAAQLVIFLRGIFDGTRFGAAGSAIVVGIFGCLLYGGAIAVAAGLWRPHPRLVSVAVIAIAIAATLRFHLPRLLLKHEPPTAYHLLAVDQSPDLVAFLRELAAAQEQRRLSSGAYTSSVDSLGDWISQPAGTTVQITARDNRAWSARATLAGVTCSIWVRDSTLRGDDWSPEGSPTCGEREFREPRETIPTVVVPHAETSASFDDADISGTWMQHRADERRTGIATSNDGRPGYRWQTRIGGSIRSSVAIAGNQVFVGTHGNGEFVGLTLDSGKVGFRIRAPNWVHHEPVITDSLVIVGFGNNEWEPGRDSIMGSDPSGVAAYDRRTGVERWRVRTVGSVMGSPAVHDSIVAVSTGGREAVGVRLRDGKELWRVRVTGTAEMANPLIADSLMIYGVEKVNVCALDVRTGRRLYCRQAAPCCWGAGHASAAISADVVIQTLAGGRYQFGRKPRAVDALLRKLAGIPQNLGRPRTSYAVGFRPVSGEFLWGTRLGTGTIDPGGHLAGTPVIVDSVAYLVSIYNGHVVAIDAQSGDSLWSTAANAARGSVTVTGGFVMAATADTGFVVMNAATGEVRCRQRLPARADRAGLTISGNTGVLTLRNGTVMARPVADWLTCKA